MKRKIMILGLTALLSMAVVGCSVTKNENIKKSMIGTSSQLNKIDIDSTEVKSLTYTEAQSLMKKINSELSEFKPQLTPDNQTIILNLETREVLDKLEKEYIIINTIPYKKNYTIQIEGNIFKNKSGDISKNDASINALYNLLKCTNDISELSITKCIDMLNNDGINNKELKNVLKSFDNVDFDFTKDQIKFNLKKSYNRKEAKTNNEKITYKEYKKQQNDLKENLTKYTKDFAKANNLKPIISETSSDKNKLDNFGIKNNNGLTQLISVNTSISNLNDKTVSNVYKFKVPQSKEDPKNLQLSKDFLVGAIRIINSITKSDINYGDIESVVKSNDIRSNYLGENSSFETVFEYSSNLEKSLVNNEYTFTQKISI